MGWRREGLVLAPTRFASWATSHAMVPVVHVGNGGPELLFSARDADGRSHTARAALIRDGDVWYAEPEPVPVLGPGALGAFDDCGAMASCLVHEADRELLYYIGWQRGVTVPFATYIGLATSVDGDQRFRRVSAGPVVGRSVTDPFLATSPWVMVENGLWRMWYASGQRWEATTAGPKHYYRILYAESQDGVRWHPTGRVCIDFADASEYAIARPCVVLDGDRYRMWFAYRGDTYRIGYAESSDGLDWVRDDARGGLTPSGQGWESQSVEYGCVFDHEAIRWMVYNGNGYGETGIGIARWEDGP